MNRTRGLSLPDAVHLRTTVGAGTRRSGLAVLHGDLLSVSHLPHRAALEAVGLHSTSPPYFTSGSALLLSWHPADRTVPVSPATAVSRCCRRRHNPSSPLRRLCQRRLELRCCLAPLDLTPGSAGCPDSRRMWGAGHIACIIDIFQGLSSDLEAKKEGSMLAAFLILFCRKHLVRPPEAAAALVAEDSHKTAVQGVGAAAHARRQAAPLSGRSGR